MNYATRLPIAFALATIFTALLFYFLWGMIHVGFDIQELAPAKKIEFSRLRKDTDIEVKRPEQAKLEKPTVVPDMPSMSAMSSSVDSGSVAMINPDLGRAKVGKMNIGAGSDRDVMPLVRINPDYPQRANSRGIEGYVVIQFTITPQGTVKDPVVIEAQPKGYFEQAAIKAILRWKYNPKVVDGTAVERRGIRVKLSFDLED